MSTLYIVVPCYNEQAVLPITSDLFLKKLNGLIEAGKISNQSKILFVDDGSKDKTWEIIQSLSIKDTHFIGIRQSRNRGHQNALLAGLMEAKDSCDISISIDCDGQDDINVMEDMVDAYHNGCDVVYGVRKDRSTDTVFKRKTAQSFYRLMKWLGADIIYNHADYRLLSNRVLCELSNFNEVNIFLRCMIPLVGFQSTSVFYDRKERIAGESHYPFKKMLSFAFDGITSFSIKPLRLILFAGISIAFFSIIGIIWSLIVHLLGKTVSGWSSLICIICFIGGVQMISIGVLGEYIGKIYLETKARPRYIISERTNFKDS